MPRLIPSSFAQGNRCSATVSRDTQVKLAATLGAIGAATLYIFWPFLKDLLLKPSKKKTATSVNSVHKISAKHGLSGGSTNDFHEQSNVPPGLTNYGNSCYLNALLQVFHT